MEVWTNGTSSRWNGSVTSLDASGTTRYPYDCSSSNELRLSDTSHHQALTSSRERNKTTLLNNSVHANQLRFERLRGLTGRDEEIATLNDCLRRLEGPALHGRRKRSRRELVLISGASGTGKSSLAYELKKPVEAAKGIFCSGKYDQVKPFGGLSMACQELCDTILLRRPHTLRERLVTKLGKENIDLLSILVPQIKEIAEDRNSSKSEWQETNIIRAADDKKKERLEAAFRIFFRFVSELFAPVVVVLDDLQWADSCSLETMHSLLTDHDNTGLMIVGCYRSDQVDDDHFLTKADVSVTRIQIGNLDVHNMMDLLAELLSKEHGDVKELAHLCMARTEGNVFYVKEFLSMLVRRGFLKFHLGTFQWDWNITLIETETSVASNMVDLIQARMKKMEPQVIDLLKLAACLGNTFDRDVLRILWEHRCDNPQEGSLQLSSRDTLDDTNSQSTFVFLLQHAIHEACLVEISSSESIHRINDGARETCESFRFAHDKIQESFLSLIPQEALAKVQNSVGKVLLNALSPSDLEAMLFVVVNLINCGEDEKSLKMAEINLLAATKAKQLAAFSSMAAFALNGMSHLPPENEWALSAPILDLAMNLYALAAFSEMSLGNFEVADRYCDVMLAQDKATKLQKCAAYRVRLNILHYKTGKAKEGIDLSLYVLSTLGIRIPRQKFVRRLVARRYVRETKECIPTLEDLKSMKMMTDQVQLEKIDLIERAGSLSYILGDSDGLYMILRCLFVQESTKNHGLCEFSAAGCASLANVLMHQCGDFETAVQLAELSLEMQKLLPRFSEARTVCTANFYVLGWVRPLHSISKQLLLAYEMAVRAGNVSSTSTALHLYLWTEMYASQRLDLVEQDFEIYFPQINYINRQLIIPIWQLCQNLLGKSKNTIILTGDVYDEKEAIGSERHYIKATFPRYKCFACLFFAAYEVGADVALEVQGERFFKQAFPGAGYGMEFLPFGMCCYAAVKRTSEQNKRRKYRRMGDQFRKSTRKLVKKGCVNLIHVLRLLDAEFFALGGKTEEAHGCYQKAVIEAARGGFLYSAAVASERYSDYLIGDLKDSSEAEYRLKEARKYYQEWGATRVVERLTEKLQLML